MRTTMKKLILASLLLSTILLAAGSANAAPLYFPHVDTSLPWQTEIAVINTGNQTVTGTLRGISNAGLPVETKDVSLSARGRRQITVADEFTNHINIGYIVFETDSIAVQGYTKFYQVGKYRAAIPAVKEVNASDIYISHIDAGAQWWTGISLVNTTAATKTLTMTFNNGQSRVITLTANQHQAFLIDPQPDIQSAVITNASGVIGLELFGNIGGSDHLEGILLTDKTATTLYYPHVENNGWWTGVVAYNPSASACTITITPYSAQGDALTPSTRTIAGRGKYVGLVSGLGLPAQTAWFRIDSTSPLSGFELFSTADGNQLAAYAGGGGTGAKAGVFPKIEKNGGWTGIAFVNTEDSTASVTLTAYNNNGIAVATQVLNVGGHVKVVNFAETIFSQDTSSATYVAYASDKNVVGFQLNGTSDGMMLDGLPALGGSNSDGPVFIVDFSNTNIVTSADQGFNDFSGNIGSVNKNGLSYGGSSLVCSSGNSCAQRFIWDFTINSDVEAYTGLFYSLFGLTDTLATFDGNAVQTVFFPEHSLDLDKIDGEFAEPGGPRKFNKIGVSMTYNGTQPLKLRVELKDAGGGGRFHRFDVPVSNATQTIVWDFRDPGAYTVVDGHDLDVHRAKVLTMVIEKANIGDHITNPDKGTIDMRQVWFVPEREELSPATDSDLLDYLARRTAQYFVDWSSRKQESLGLPQDRSSLGDLLTVGGVGFALPAYIISAERGWITRDSAIEKVLSVLRIMNNQAAFGPERLGRIGYKGWLYHFLGVDGRRKLNFDVQETPNNEALKTVELSTIDTGLALMGVLASQSYFTGNDSREAEIRSLAQQIYDRVEWGFMFEPSKRQFYLGWKPNEPREGPLFEIPDSSSSGKYSSKNDGSPATLDYYTDEALIVILLAAGSTTHAVDASSAYCSLIHNRDSQGLIRSYPGALFTYQFLHAFINTNGLNLSACPGEGAINWYDNSRKAINTVMSYAETQSNRFKTYGPDAWGLTSAEGADDLYRSYGASPLAVDPNPPQDGTVAYYGMISSISFGDDIKARVIQAANKAWERKHVSPRFGLPDAHNDDISQAVSGNSLLRNSGPWVQRQLFAIDEGPMLLHLENQRSGLMWNLLAQNANIQRGLSRLRAPQ